MSTVVTSFNLDVRPTVISLSPARADKNDISNVYPSSLSMKLYLVGDVEVDGIITDAEIAHTLIVTADSSKVKDGIVDPDLAKLNNLLRSYDYKKYPLQIPASPPRYRALVAKSGNAYTVDREPSYRSLLSAVDLLEKLKPTNS